MQPAVPIKITRLDAIIPEGIDLLWKGYPINSGRLQIHLDDQARGEDDNCGELDYEKNLARARFNVAIDLTGIARAMEPLRAVLQSEGVITEDHNFGMSGPMEVRPHPLFGPGGVSLQVLPGR